MSLDLITFTEIAGAHVYYPPNGRKPRKVRLSRAFHATLTACLEDLWQRCPWGQAQWIGSLGCYVAYLAPSKRDTGRHKIGEAIDVSDVWWEGMGKRVHSADPGAVDMVSTARYLAVEAVFRLHFQTVLDWWFNAAHRDHWHIDCGRGEPTWEGRKNQVRFLQAALRYVWGASVWPNRSALVIDGDFGPKTQRALAEYAQLTDQGDGWWTAFLEETARRGFAV